MAMNVSGQAPPGYGAGLATLLYAAIVLSVAPPFLAAIVGGIAGYSTSYTTTVIGVLVGIDSGIGSVVLAWMMVFLTVWLDIALGGTFEAFVLTPLVIAVLAPFGLVRMFRRRPVPGRSYQHGQQAGVVSELTGFAR